MNAYYLRPLLAALTLVSSLGIAACGDEISDPNPSAHPAAMLLKGAVHPDSVGDARSTLFYAVVAAGYPVDTLTSVDSSAVASLLAGKEILFVPYGLNPIDIPTGLAIRAFVDSGGTVVVLGGAANRGWVNNAFGLSLQGAAGFSGHEAMPMADDASATPFSGGPATILANNEVDPFDFPSLPVTAKVAYLSPGTDPKAGVVVLPSGAGRLVLLGWNWYDGAPVGSQDGGWTDLLNRIANF